MKFISSGIHGVLDYAISLFLITAPWVAGFDRSSAIFWVPVGAGFFSLLYSMLTNYELGRLKLIPMRVHLALDMLSGLLLAASPWLFGFSDQLYLPHVLVGATEIVIVLLSDTVAYGSKNTEASNRSASPAHPQ